MIEPLAAAVFRPLDDGGVVLHAETGAFFQVNASGRFIWEILESGADRTDLVGALVDKFGIESSLAESDVDTFLSALTERDLISIQ